MEIRDVYKWIRQLFVALAEKSEVSKKDVAKGKIYIKKGDARNLDFVPDESIDLICTHPPYADIIKYSDGASIVNLNAILVWVIYNFKYKLHIQTGIAFCFIKNDLS